jgi:hypothetical protein
MIESLIGKIAGFFEKDFLFASFLPALIFLFGLAVTFAVAIGLDGVLTYIASWTALESAIIVSVSGFGVVVFAYVLNALRASIAHFWSGNSNFLLWPLLRLGESYRRWQFRRLREREFDFSEWGEVHKFFVQYARYDASKPPLPKRVRWELWVQVRRLHPGMGPEMVKQKLRHIITAWGHYSGEDLKDLYRAIKMMLLEWDEIHKTKQQTDITKLDREFGSLATIKATKLGNIITSYNEYPFKRYKMEAEIFWPRLEQASKPEFLARVQEPRILLDFALTMTSLGVIYIFLILIVGPWVWFDSRYWGTLAVIGIIASFFFYRVGISAAIQLGEMMRAGFDLFRLTLMNALERPHPDSFNKEQEQWKELSELVVYGTASDFKIRERTEQ